MFETMQFTEILKMLLPIIIIELALKVYCLINLFKNGANHLPKWAWALIITFVNVFGPVGYLIMGKRRY